MPTETNPPYMHRTLMRDIEQTIDHLHQATRDLRAIDPEDVDPACWDVAVTSLAKANIGIAMELQDAIDGANAAA